ncbi:hypothetical protein Ahy_B09g098406 isoform B [Arachis hypogaea]|uniref:Uncharacterized protein n=1 Tax=Arachis hypogaea TaxID=3818 RepID=A0A444XR86_ARAHY|nr:hypothetical protein Ahy_B09g098406 isoform B [Arachis hypogaea]
MMIVGHLGKLALSSTTIATSLCAVSGFKFGMSCIGNSRRPSLWSKAIYQIWCSNLHLYSSNSGHLSCSLCFLGFYQIQSLKLQFCPYDNLILSRMIKHLIDCVVVIGTYEAERHQGLAFS